MDWQFKVGLGAAVLFGLLQFAVKAVPSTITWPGIAIGVMLIVWGLLPNDDRIPNGPALLFIFCVAGMVASAIWFRETLAHHYEPADIVLLPPFYDFKLEWRAPHNNEIIMLPDRRGQDGSPLRTGVPVFRIKNIGTAVARDVSIEWRIEKNIREALSISARLKKHTVRLTDHNFGIFEGNLDENFISHAMDTIKTRGKSMQVAIGSGYVAGYATSEYTQIPYLAPEINNDKYQDADMTFSVDQLLQFLLVALSPEGITLEKTIVPIFVSIKWMSPDGEQSTYYRIEAKSLNISDTAPAGTQMPPSPEVLALVSFEVTRVIQK